MFSIIRYSVKNKTLMPWVKFIWFFEAMDANIRYKLLPTDSIDIILNLSGDIVYETNLCCISATPFHINGLRSKHSYIHQKGDIRVFGVSCYPFGLYPFINKSLANIQDEVVDLFKLSPSLARNIEVATSNNSCTDRIIENIEKALCQEINVTEDYLSMANMLSNFLQTEKNATIQSFCSENGIHAKTFMRNIRKYTGYTPKTLRVINHFQKIGNQLLHQKSKSMTSVAYDNGFSDQSHLIREFRKLSGSTPCTFQKEKDTVKENVNYKYQ
jgi:AraC-like DNA-binding protein